MSCDAPLHQRSAESLADARDAALRAAGLFRGHGEAAQTRQVLLAYLAALPAVVNLGTDRWMNLKRVRDTLIRDLRDWEP